MKLGEVARVSRGLVTGDARLFVMTREEAKQRGLESFVRPVIGGAREVKGVAVVRDTEDRRVVLLVTPRDVDSHPALRAYLGNAEPRIGSPGSAPIVATYVGVPHFAANPDGLVVLNSLYRVSPRIPMVGAELVELVDRFNRAAPKWMGSRRSSRLSPSQFEDLEI